MKLWKSVLTTLLLISTSAKLRRKEEDRRRLSNSPCQEKRFAALTNYCNPEFLENLMIENQISSFCIAFLVFLDYRFSAEMIQCNSIQASWLLNLEKSLNFWKKGVKTVDSKEVDTKYWDRPFSKLLSVCHLTFMLHGVKLWMFFLANFNKKNSHMRTRWSKSSLYWWTIKSFKFQKCVKDFSDKFGTRELNTRSLVDDRFVV